MEVVDCVLLWYPSVLKGMKSELHKQLTTQISIPTVLKMTRISMPKFLAS